MAVLALSPICWAPIGRKLDPAAWLMFCSEQDQSTIFQADPQTGANRGYEQVDRLLSHVLQVHRAHFKGDNLSVVVVLYELGVTRLMQGKYQEAEDLLTHARRVEE